MQADKRSASSKGWIDTAGSRTVEVVVDSIGSIDDDDRLLARDSSKLYQ